MWLRQSTSVSFLVGPVLDTTGLPVTTAGTSDFRISKAGSTAIFSGGTATHDTNGNYRVTLTTANTDTVGLLEIGMHNTSMAMSVHRFMVQEPTIYDDFVNTATNATGGLRDVARINGQTVSAAAPVTFPGTVASETTVASKASQTSVDTLASYVDTEVAAIKAKTDNLPSDPADASDIASSFVTVNATLSTIAEYIDTEVAAIKAKTDNLPAQPAAVGDIPTAAAIADAVLEENVDDHDNVAHSLAKYISIIKKANTVIDGTVTNAVSPTTLSFSSNVNYPTGALKNSVLLFTTGNLIEQNSPILNYTNSNGVLTVEAAFTQAPAVGDQFIIVPTNYVHSIAAIAGGVWSNVSRTLSSFDFQVTVGGYASGQAPLQSLGANAPVNWINAAAITTDAITGDKIAASAVTKISTGVSNLEVLTRLASMIESDGAGQFRFDTIAVSMAVGGGGGGAVNITVEDRSITVT